jgi:EmrB/QacA subfamily drug resistance transporter
MARPHRRVVTAEAIGELRVSGGPDAGLSLAVAAGVVLGRGADADVVLRDPGGKLSRRHATIRLDRGLPVIEDLGSTNGTFVNGKRIAGACPLRAGDRIDIGATTLEFVPAADRADAASPRREAPQVAPLAADPELRIVDGPDTGRAAVVRGSATIGREPECDLQVVDSEVSRRHAKLTLRDGVAFIDDLHSANGTYVNGERVLERRRLDTGDRIQIGEATIVLTSAVSAAVGPGPPPTTARAIVVRLPRLLGSDPAARKWWTLAIVLVAGFMLLLDITIVGVALPSISESLHPSFTLLQWIVDAYALTLSVLLLTAGSLADIFGRKRLLTIGLVVFTASSVVCAQASTATMLVLARGAQGIGGALMYGCLLALIVQEFPANERAIPFGLYGSVNALAVALGPIVGGALVQVLGWRSIFYLNVPIATAALVVTHRRVVNLPGPETKVDVPGLVTFSGAVFLAVFATIRGSADGWTSRSILGCYVAAVLLTGFFLLIESHAASPMLDLGLFRNPTFVGASASGFTLNFAVIALIFFFTVWFQSVLGYSPLGTGARMLAIAAPGLAVAPLAGKLTKTVDPRIVLTLSLALAGAGALTMTGVDASSSWVSILPGLLLAGTALGLVGPTLSSTATGVVPPWRSGMAGGLNNTMRQLGTTAGIAVLGVLLSHEVVTHVERGLAGSFLGGASKKLGDAIAAGGTRAVVARAPTTARAGLLHVARDGYSAGLSRIFLSSAIAAGLGAVAAFALVRRRHLLHGPPAGGRAGGAALAGGSAGGDAGAPPGRPPSSPSAAPTGR